MGREKFEIFCYEHGYRVEKPKDFRVTSDNRGVTLFPNLRKELGITSVIRFLVREISYCEMRGKVYRITLIMDIFYPEFVGFSASESLRMEDTTLPALNCARKTCGQLPLEGNITHSNGGGQYYSNAFKISTKKLKMSNSMTEETVCGNSHTERFNGMIKNFIFTITVRNV